MSLDVEKMKEITVNSIPFAQRANIDVVTIEPNYVKLKMPLEGNQNHIGTMYAGALFTLGEIPGGAVFMSSFEFGKYYPIVKEMSIKFKKPITGNAYVEARISPEEVSRIQETTDAEGKCDFTLEEEITNEDGEVSAYVTGVYQARKMGN